MTILTRKAISQASIRNYEVNNGKKVKKHDGRTSDLTFKWMLTTLGPEWEQWQELAAEWMAIQHAELTTSVERWAVFESYLLEHAPYATDICLFFKGYNGHICSTEELEARLRKTINSPGSIKIYKPLL